MPRPGPAPPPETTAHCEGQSGGELTSDGHIQLKDIVRMTGGANPMFSGDVSMFFTSQVQGFREDLSHPIGFLQIVAIGVSFLIAWLLARKLHHDFDKSMEKVKTHTRIFKLIPAQFSQLLGYLFWLLLMWFSMELFKKFTCRSPFCT
jgi:hypothetical protein